MAGLVLKKGDESRIFSPDGVVTAGTVSAKRGTWRCGDAGHPNALAYEFDGTAAPPVAVRWSFNQKNQLVAVIPAAANGGADSDAFVFPGRIKIDDNRDVVYEVFDDTGEPNGVTLTVYGDLKVSDVDGALEVHFAGGGTPARIRGDVGVSSLSTGMDPSPVFKASDFLRFQATTTNTIDGELVDAEAAITWVGQWGLKDSQLVFAAEMKNTPGGTATAIVLAGRTKAVAGGLAYYAGPDGSQELALEVSGSHTWNGGDAKWDVSLGYSKKQLSAKVKGGFTMSDQVGRKFTLNGDIEFTEGGSNTTLAMSLAAEYQWGPGGVLRFDADVSLQDGVVKYDLQLEGQFDFNGTRLTFSIKFTRDATGSHLVVKLATRGDSNFKFQLALVMNADDPSKVNVSLSFSFQVKWVDGVAVKQKVA